jgi:hypothetical protein
MQSWHRFRNTQIALTIVLALHHSLLPLSASSTHSQHLNSYVSSASHRPMHPRLTSRPAYCSQIILPPSSASSHAFSSSSQQQSNQLPNSSSSTSLSTLRDLLQSLELVNVRLTDLNLLHSHHKSKSSSSASSASSSSSSTASGIPTSQSPQSKREAYAYKTNLSLSELGSRIDQERNRSVALGDIVIKEVRLQ